VCRVKPTDTRVVVQYKSPKGENAYFCKQESKNTCETGSVVLEHYPRYPSSLRRNRRLSITGAGT
jgi:hypothetical protein